MVVKADQQRMKALLKETITLLCKNGLNYKTEFCVEALIGITLDKGDVFLVNINETIKDGLIPSKVESSEADTCAEIASPLSTEQYGYEPMGEEGSSNSSHHGGRRRRRSRQDRPTSPNTSRSFAPSPKTHKNTSSMLGNEEVRSTDRSYKVEQADQMPSCRFGDGEQNRTDSEMNTDSGNKRMHPEQEADRDESLGAHSVSSKRLRSDDDGSNGSDDVVFVKDEPFSDSELEQVSLGIAQHAQSQAMSELGYLPGTSQSDVPSGHSEPLPGCSGWAIPSPGTGVSAALGAPPGDSPSNVNSSLGQGCPTPYLDGVLQRVRAHGGLSSERAQSMVLSILLCPGPCTPLRTVQRHFLKVRADNVEQAMTLISRPRGDPAFVGEYMVARRNIRVFYKCPPHMVAPSALAAFGISVEVYKQQYLSMHETRDVAKNIKMAEYYSKLMEECPFV